MSHTHVFCTKKSLISDWFSFLRLIVNPALGYPSLAIYRHRYALFDYPQEVIIFQLCYWIYVCELARYLWHLSAFETTRSQHNTKISADNLQFSSYTNDQSSNRYWHPQSGNNSCMVFFAEGYFPWWLPTMYAIAVIMNEFYCYIMNRDVLSHGQFQGESVIVLIQLFWHLRAWLVCC